MANLTGLDRTRYVQDMFTRIAQQYDLMNRVMTAGQDVRWRREVIRRAQIPRDGQVLDLGAGTGDLAREALRRSPSCRALAADFTLEMMRVGKSRTNSASSEVVRLAWAATDAQRLPFPNNSFDAVVSGFLLRNVNDVTQSLREQYRVLKEGGRIVALDTTPPPDTLLRPLIRFHLQTVIPALGQWISGQADAYHYLPDSTESFLEPEQLAARLMAAGFQEVGFHRVMFGTVAIHWGTKITGAGGKDNE